MKHEITSYNTKRMIADSLKKLMEEKAFSKITVSEIIRECKINRKTFYYHFEDIYDLLKWTFDEEAIGTVKEFDLCKDYKSAIAFCMDYIEKNRYIINCAYDSVGREVMKNFFYSDFAGVIEKVIEESGGEKLPDEYRKFCAKFYTEAIAGMIIEFIKEKDENKRKRIIDYLSDIIEMQFKIAK